MQDLKYPIGRLPKISAVRPEQLAVWISDIAGLPQQMRHAVAGLNDARLNTPYRPDGWTIRQVVHHVADSHINGYCRFRWALTEDNPTIKTYAEDRWAMLADYALPVEPSLQLLDMLHLRWVTMLRSMKPEQFLRPLRNPATGDSFLAKNVALYSWHGRHHVAHITRLRERQNW